MGYSNLSFILILNSLFQHLGFKQYSGLICRDQSSNLKFRLALVFLSKKIKIDRKQELNIPSFFQKFRPKNNTPEGNI
jgi:hypothetical protein